MRLFVAINFNDDTCSRLADIQGELRSRSQGGNFTLPENLHLTLAFIGEASPKKADNIKAVLETVTFTPFDIEISRLGTFSGGTLWWAGIGKAQPLMELQREVEHKLALCGIETDGREYSPHITLGRKVETSAKPWKNEPFGEKVTRIDLMKSERVGGRLVYTAIYSRETEV